MALTPDIPTDSSSDSEASGSGSSIWKYEVAIWNSGGAAFMGGVSAAGGNMGADGAGHFGTGGNGPLATALRYKMTPELARQMSTSPNVRIASYDPRLLMKTPGKATEAEIAQIREINDTFHKAGKKTAFYTNRDWSKLDGDALHKAVYGEVKAQSAHGFDTMYIDATTKIPEAKLRVIAEATYQASLDAIAERAKTNPAAASEKPTMFWNGSPAVLAKILKDNPKYVEALNNGGSVVIERGMSQAADVEALMAQGVKTVVIAEFFQLNDPKVKEVTEAAAAFAKAHPDIHVMMLPSNDAAKATLKNSENVLQGLGMDLPTWDGRWGANATKAAAASLGVSTRANYVRGGPSRLVTVKGGHVNFQVDERFAGNFQGFLDVLAQRGYQFSTRGGAGGYANRTMASGGHSQHASGNAIDVNPADNPVHGGGRNNLPSDVGLLAKSFGLTWGGYWGIQDGMHFEYNPAHGAPEMTLAQYQQAKSAASLKAMAGLAQAPNLAYTNFSDLGIRAAAPTSLPADYDLADLGSAPKGPIDRTKFIAELKEKPWLVEKLAWMVQGERPYRLSNATPHQMDLLLAQAESAFNRAAINERNIERALYNGREAVQAGLEFNNGYYAMSTYRGNVKPTEKEVAIFREVLLPKILAGSNKSEELYGFVMTGNASAHVARKGVATGRYAKHHTGGDGETVVISASDLQKLRANPSLLYGTQSTAPVASAEPTTTEAQRVAEATTQEPRQPTPISHRSVLVYSGLKEPETEAPRTDTRGAGASQLRASNTATATPAAAPAPTALAKPDEKQQAAAAAPPPAPAAAPT